MKTPPYYMSKELSLLNHKYFFLYNEKKWRWEIRKWRCACPRKRTMDTDSELISTVCKRDDQGRDIGYLPLDMRVIHGLNEGFYWARKIKEAIQMVDSSNARLMEQADIEDEYIARYVAKSIWRYYREPMVIGGVSGGDRPWKY